MIRRPPRSTRTDTLFPYTTLFRSKGGNAREAAELGKALHLVRDAGFDMMAGDRLVIKRRGELVARLRLHVGEVDVEDARRRPVLRRVAVMRLGGRLLAPRLDRSEERSVGKGCVSSCRSRGSPYH